jgi:hypothetical protein
MTPAPSLDQLISTVQADASSDDVLDQLATASALATNLAETGDALLGHFVDRCRRAGRSWAEIGTALKVTKQAAQKRFVNVRIRADLVKRVAYTPEFHQAVEQAKTAARELDHGFIGTEHFVVALFADPDAVPAQVLADLGLTRDRVVNAITRRVPRGTPGRGGYTKKAAAILQRGAMVEAVLLKEEVAAPEHLLLAIYREADSVGAAVLEELGADRAAVKERVQARIEQAGS